MERLQKYIASSGYTSRRKAEDLIREGRVSVNGQVVTELGTKVKSGDVVLVDGEAIVGENKVYYLFYKPQGCVCTLDDEFDRPKVIDYFEDVEERIYPVGRLDFDTTGALIMSNDGDFANMIMHPRSHLEKIYEVTGKKTMPCKIKVTYKDIEHKTTVLKIKLYEGKNRQVKKMFESVGHPVKRLHRISVGCVNLKGLRPGEYRRLKPQEVKDLKKLVGK